MVSRFAAQHSQPVLQRGEGTQGACAFNEKPPDQRGSMEPCSARPPEGEQRTGDDEQHEEKMNERNRVGKDGVPHESYESRASRGDAGG